MTAGIGRAADSGATGAIRVLVADDQRIVREGLATLLGLLTGVEVVGMAADGAQAVAMALELRPDIVLMDLRMPVCDGADATRRLREHDARIKVLVLTTYADDRSVIDALRAGARGYLTKDAGADEIHAALLRVATGQAVIDPAVQHHLLDAIRSGPPAASEGGSAESNPDASAAGGFGPSGSGPSGSGVSPGGGVPGGAVSPRASTAEQSPPRPDGLTQREAEVLALIAHGLSNAEIAARLVVSEATVKSHINHMFAKIGARDRAQAVRYAYQHGLAAPTPR